jgi:hypothetical protein
MIGEQRMEIHPFESIGPLNFNMSRTTARDTLQVPLQRFRKYENCPDIEVSEELGLHLYYDARDCLEFVEAFEPAKVSFCGLIFLGRDVQDVVAEMEERGLRPTETDDYGVTFGDAGIALTSPSGIVEGVAAFREGYYDQ